MQHGLFITPSNQLVRVTERHDSLAATVMTIWNKVPNKHRLGSLSSLGEGGNVL